MFKLNTTVTGQQSSLHCLYGLVLFHEVLVGVIHIDRHILLERKAPLA